MKTKIKELRKKNKLSQEELALAVGTTRQTITSIVIIFAGIIAGYFNEIVFYSLIGCAMFQLYFSVILKVYYSRKL